jgi:hypothetical protein
VNLLLHTCTAFTMAGPFPMGNSKPAHKSVENVQSWLSVLPPTLHNTLLLVHRLMCREGEPTCSRLPRLAPHPLFLPN